MKQYIDGIKDDTCKLVNMTDKILKDLSKKYFTRIPITYYKPLTIIDDGEFGDIHFDTTTQPFYNPSIKWIDGQPYELIIWSKD